MKLLCIVYALLFLGCVSIHKKHTGGNETIVILEKEFYNYSTSKNDIPKIVIDSLSSLDGSPFKIGDHTDKGKFDFSDAHIEGENKYERELYFVLLSDSFCMLTYKQGGIGVHNVVDFLKYKGEFRHIRYRTLEDVSDTTLLKGFLQGNPRQSDK